MANLSTKYSVGDVVWYASTTTTKKQHPCPDCLDTKVWKALSPAGAEFEFACPRCAGSYSHNRDLSLSYSAFAPFANRLTIGSIKVNTAPSSHDSGVSYMCVETGIGGGTVYGEDRLFETQEAALATAEALAVLQNAETNWVVKQYNQSLSISDYQLHNAQMKLAQDETSRARSMLWHIDDLMNKIEEAEELEAAKEAVDDYRRYDWASDKAKVAEAAE